MLLQKWRSLVFLKIKDLTTACKYVLNSGTLRVHFNSSIPSPGQSPVSAGLSTFAGKLPFPKELRLCSWISAGYFRHGPVTAARSSGNHRPLEERGAERGLLQPSHPTAPAFLQEAGGRCWLPWVDPGTLMGTKDWAPIPSSSVIPSLSTFELTQLAAFYLHAFCSPATAERSET